MNQKLTAKLIVKAYCVGIFPMADEHSEIRWYSPDPRCIIDLNEFHTSRRLMRTYKSGKFDLCINKNFAQVVKQCRARTTTWISDEIASAYGELHCLGLAHSVEAYRDGLLVGGLYGVSLGGAFMGESMFHRVTDASKVCMVALCEQMRKRGFVLLDCQYATGHLNSLGAKLINRDEYLLRLSHALTLNCQFV